MARNLMLDFMQGYNFVNDINRQKHLDAERADDRAFQRGLMERQDIRAQTAADQSAQLFKQAQEMRQGAIDLATAKNNAYYDSLGLTDLKPAEQQEVQAKMGPLLADPEKAGQALAIGDNIVSAFEAGKNPAQSEVVQYLNLMGGHELQQRANGQGLQSLEVHRVYPYQNGNVLMEFKATRPDGSTYIAPATQGKSTDQEKDKNLQIFPAKDMISWFGGSQASLRAILDAESKIGSTSTVDAYKAYKQRLAEQQGEVAKHLLEKKIDQMYEKPEYATVGDKDTGIYAFDKHTGQKGALLVPAAAGLSDDHLPANAQMVEYLVKNGIAKDKTEAWKQVKLSASDPIKLVTDMVAASEKAQTDAMIMPGDANYKDRTTLLKEAQGMVRDIQQGYLQGGNPSVSPPAPPPSAPSGPAPAPGATTAVNPAFAFLRRPGAQTTTAPRSAASPQNLPSPSAGGVPIPTPSPSAPAHPAAQGISRGDLGPDPYAMGGKGTADALVDMTGDQVAKLASLVAQRYQDANLWEAFKANDLQKMKSLLAKFDTRELRRSLYGDESTPAVAVAGQRLGAGGRAY